MKKIAFICFALIVALGGLGVGYAHWQGTLDITGTVTAGTFGAALTQNNAVISAPIDNEDFDTASGAVNLNYIGTGNVYSGWIDAQKPQDIGSATCVLSDEKPAGAVDGVMDKITITVNDAYPCYEVWVPVDVHCAGSVPIKVYYTMTAGPVANELDVSMVTDPAAASGDKTLVGAVSAATAVKLHNCETARALLYIHGLQPGMVQGKSYTITITITYIQAQ